MAFSKTLFAKIFLPLFAVWWVMTILVSWIVGADVVLVKLLGLDGSTKFKMWGRKFWGAAIWLAAWNLFWRFVLFVVWAPLAFLLLAHDFYHLFMSKDMSLGEFFRGLWKDKGKGKDEPKKGGFWRALREDWGKTQADFDREHAEAASAQASS